MNTQYSFKAYQITQLKKSERGMVPKYMSALESFFYLFLIYLMSALKILHDSVWKKKLTPYVPGITMWERVAS